MDGRIQQLRKRRIFETKTISWSNREIAATSRNS